MIEYQVHVHDNRTEWLLNGLRHRLGGPAVEFPDGKRVWYEYDKRHRLDGPAVECANGDKYWFLNGFDMTETEHAHAVSHMNMASAGKTVEIDGVKYVLMLTAV